MLIVVYILFISVAFGLNQSTTENYAVIQTSIDELTEQSTIDGAWIDYMITAPATINLLGQVMVVASRADISFEQYSPKRVYKYMKYPKSFRATLLQISNEGYRAFLNAHSSMNKIRLYMRHIPQHMNTMIKALSSKASPKLVSRVLSTSKGNIERISKTCVILATGVNNSFTSVMNLLDEVIEITQVTQGLSEREKLRNEVELRITRQLHIDMQKLVELRRQNYEEIRGNVQKTQEEYSRALDNIPTGFKALALDLGRAVISTLKAYANIHIAKTTMGLSLIKQLLSDDDGAQSFSTNQIINFASRFSESLDKFITKLSSNENQTIDKNELKGYNIVFGVFDKMINIIPNNNLKTKASGLVQQAVTLVGRTMKNNSENIIDSLKNLANNLKPFMAAEQLSSINKAPISTPTRSDSSQNELLKARLAQDRLTHMEKLLDQYAVEHTTAMQQVHQLSAKLTRMNLKVVRLKEVLEVLKEAFKLLGNLRTQWNELVLFFSDFSAQIVASFDKRLTTFLDSPLLDDDDSEKLEINRILSLDLLNGNSISLYHESYLLYTLSRTYYDVSTKYLMPRLSGLQLLLAATNKNERILLFRRLKNDTKIIQSEVQKLVNERKEKYKKLISEKRIALNGTIKDVGPNGNEEDIIHEGKKLLAYEKSNDEDADDTEADVSSETEPDPDDEDLSTK